MLMDADIDHRGGILVRASVYLPPAQDEAAGSNEEKTSSTKSPPKPDHIPGGCINAGQVYLRVTLVPALGQQDKRSSLITHCRRIALKRKTTTRGEKTIAAAEAIAAKRGVPLEEVLLRSADTISVAEVPLPPIPDLRQCIIAVDGNHPHAILRDGQAIAYLEVHYAHRTKYPSAEP